MTALEGRLVVVTGAASGLGAACVDTALSQGAWVVAVDASEAPMHRPVPASATDRLTTIQLNVTREGDWQSLVETLSDRGEPVHGLVNSAGVTRRARLLDVTVEEFRAVHDVNLFGPLLAIQALVPLMTPGASIVNVGSIAGVTAHFPIAYTTSKWGVRGLTHVAALELGSQGIRVNLVNPGFIDTPMSATAPPELRAASIESASLGRAGEPAEVAAVVCFLLSDSSSYMTGVELGVDGGAASHAGAKLVSDAHRARTGK